MSHIGVHNKQGVLCERRAKAEKQNLRASNIPKIQHSTTKGSAPVNEIYTLFVLKPKKLSVKKIVEERVNTVAPPSYDGHAHVQYTQLNTQLIYISLLHNYDFYVAASDLQITTIPPFSRIPNSPFRKFTWSPQE